MISKWVNQVCESLEKEPYSWRFEEYYAVCNGLVACSIWIANGASYYRLKSPNEIECSFFEKRKLKKAFRRWEQNISLLEIADRNKRKQNGDKA